MWVVWGVSLPCDQLRVISERGIWHGLNSWLSGVQSAGHRRIRRMPSEHTRGPGVAQER
jgi:hypothetical protein